MGVQEAEKLKQICSVIHQTVDTEKIYLFGSYAYGVPTQNSDFDLCVIIPDNDLRPADAIKKIRRALYPPARLGGLSQQPGESGPPDRQRLRGGFGGGLHPHRPGQGPA